VFVLVRSERVRQENIARVSVAVDIVAITVLTLLTEGGVSPLFLLHVFVISSVSVRWGLLATVQDDDSARHPLPDRRLRREPHDRSDALQLHPRAHLFRPLYCSPSAT
jgi:hypothetical protein